MAAHIRRRGRGEPAIETNSSRARMGGENNNYDGRGRSFSRSVKNGATTAVETPSQRHLLRREMGSGEKKGLETRGNNTWRKITK